MIDWLPCGYALSLIVGFAALASAAGYVLGRWREQLSLLEIFGPKHPTDLMSRTESFR
jgi:hypothetical protein